MTAYLYLVKTQWLTALTYRSEILTSVLANTIAMLASVFLWRAAYTASPVVADIAEPQMITYVLVATFMGACMSGTVEQTLQNRITQGDIAVDLIRPVSLVGSYLAVDVGLSLSACVTRLIPLLGLAVLMFQLPVPASLAGFLAFILSMVFGFLILWLITALVALLCFWYVQLGNLGAVKDGFILLLSGRIIPAWFLPEPLQKVLQVLPFQHIYQTPLSLYIGKTTLRDAVPVLLIQLLWVLGLALLIDQTWRQGRKRLQSMGG